MTYPTAGLPVTVPFFYFESGGTNITRVDATGIVSIIFIDTFVWGQERNGWLLRTDVDTPPPPPTGGPWFGPVTWRSNGARLRTDTDEWVANDAGGFNSAQWNDSGAATVGPTGAFRIKYPDTVVNIGSGIYTYTDPRLWFTIWTSDVTPPGVDEANPVRFTAKPMASAKGALQTIIDGGSP